MEYIVISVLAGILLISQAATTALVIVGAGIMENGGPQMGEGQLKVGRGLGELLEVSEPWNDQNCR